jgi:hypothetical protein
MRRWGWNESHAVTGPSSRDSPGSLWKRLCREAPTITAAKVRVQALERQIAGGAGLLPLHRMDYLLDGVIGQVR